MESLNKIAKITGIGYLVIFITGFYSNFFVIQNLIAPGEAELTVKNIIENELLFRSGILGFFIMVIADLLLAWTLYLFLKPVNEKLSLLSAWLRLVNATIFGFALVYLLNVLQLLKDTQYAILGLDFQNAQVMLSFGSFNYTWLIGLIFFGLHLLVLGYLIIKSGYIPKFLGVLLIIAGIGYLIDSFANFVIPNYSDFADLFMLIVMLPGIIGELSFTLWLLFRGNKIKYLEPNS